LLQKKQKNKPGTPTNIKKKNLKNTSFFGKKIVIYRKPKKTVKGLKKFHNE
jgi:hypothetical protein